MMDWQGSERARELLRAVAEQLKLPLMQIARQAELSQLASNETPGNFQTIQLSADAALVMVDSYLLGLELAERQQSLELESVSVSSLLNDTAHQLTAVAREYDTDLELQIAGRYGPVLAHPAALRAALVSLGYALIGVSPLEQAAKRQVLRLSAYRTKQGIVAGLYSDAADIGSEAFVRARQLYGKARQPLSGLSTTAAGVFVADTLLAAMSAKLRVARYQKHAGLAATLQPSKQLQLV